MVMLCVPCSTHKVCCAHLCSAHVFYVLLPCSHMFLHVPLFPLSPQEQLAETKARVITQQHEREQEQGDHAHMLRELQRLLQEERSLRQDAELRLEESRETLAETMQAADRGLDLEARLKEAVQEREEMRRSLQASEVERSKPDPLVEELQRDLAQLKAHFQQQLQQEIRKVCELAQSSPQILNTQ